MHVASLEVIEIYCDTDSHQTFGVDWDSRSLKITGKLPSWSVVPISSFDTSSIPLTPVLLHWHQSCCTDTSLVALTPVLLCRHQSYCIDTSLVAQTPVLLHRHQSCCMDTSLVILTPVLLCWHQSYCADTSLVVLTPVLLCWHQSCSTDCQTEIWPNMGRLYRNYIFWGCDVFHS